jgi:translation initiation factor IF-1
VRRAAGLVEVEGIVVQPLPRALYRVAVDGPREIVAHAGGGPGRNFVRILAGDRVVVRIAPHDPGRGRIVRRVGGQGRRA